MDKLNQPHFRIRYSLYLIFSLILVGCKSNVAGQHSQKDDSSTNVEDLFDNATKFAKVVLGDRLSVHYTEHKRGDLGVDALFESDELIGYTTFSNEKYQKVSSPIDLKNCILFVGKYKDEESANEAFNHLKVNSKIRASEVEGMVGIMPVQVRFMEKIRKDGERGMFTQKGSYVFFLTENGDEPPKGANWQDYESWFLTTLLGGEKSMEIIKLREE